MLWVIRMSQAKASGPDAKGIRPRRCNALWLMLRKLPRNLSRNWIGANARAGDLAAAAPAVGITGGKSRHTWSATSAFVPDLAPQVATAGAGAREGISTLVRAAVQARRERACRAARFTPDHERIGAAPFGSAWRAVRADLISAAAVALADLNMRATFTSNTGFGTCAAISCARRIVWADAGPVLADLATAAGS